MAGNKILARQEFAYSDPSAAGGIQRTRVTTTDDAMPTANQSRVESIYGQYGRLLETIEYGFRIDGEFKKRRRTVYTYQDGSSYTDKGLLHLITGISVYDAKETNNNADDGLPIARTDYVYDSPTDAAWELETYGFANGCSSSSSPPCTPPPSFDTSVIGRNSRGNVTEIRLWSDAGASTAQISFNRRYDIFGNQVKAELSCCSSKSINFNATMWYSVPSSTTDGSSTETLTTSYFYDFDTGFVNRVQDPNNLVISYAPDSAMRLRTTTYPKLSDDTKANPTLESLFPPDPAFSNYEGLMHESKLTHFDGTTQKIEVSKQWLNGAGQVMRAGTSAGASPTSFDSVKTVFDGLGRVVKQSNPYSSDQNGEPPSTTTMYWTVNEYDLLDRAVRQTLPGGSKLESEYNGAVAISTDPVGRQSRSEVDGLGRLIKVTEMDEQKNLSWVTSYTYNLNNKVTLVNQGGQTRAFKYDSLSRLMYERNPEQNATIEDGDGEFWGMKYEYNDFNGLTRLEDARGVVTTYHYDSLNRPRQAIYTTAGTSASATTTVTLTYGSAAPKKGRVESVTHGGGTDTYTFDGLSRVKTKTRNIDARNYTTTYDYNQIGQLKLLTYPSERKVEMTYDARGRLYALGGANSAGAQRSYISEMIYKPSQQIEKISLVNGLTENYSYSDERLLLTSQEVKKGTNSPLMRLTYNYDADTSNGGGTRAGNSGQLVSTTATIAGITRNQTFAYDHLGRLASASGSSTQGSWQRRYDYDRWGNKTRTHTFDTARGIWCTKQLIQYPMTDGAPTTNRASTVASVVECDAVISSPIEYDAAGNQTGDSRYVNTFDAENRLVKTVDTINGVQIDSKYDSGNKRVKKVVGAVGVHYVWEAGQVIAEHNAATGAVIREFIYAGGRRLAEESANGAKFLHQDRLSVRMITDNAGNWMSTQSHEPYGDELQESGQASKQRFTSYERDAESASDYAMNRQYAYSMGRFTSPDPIAGSITNPQSLNRYKYSGNDPVNRSDPSGLLETPWAMYWGTSGLRGGYTIDRAWAPAMLFFAFLRAGAGVIGFHGAFWNASGGAMGHGGWEHYTATSQGASFTPLFNAPPGYVYVVNHYETEDMIFIKVTLKELKNQPTIGAAPPDNTWAVELAFDWVFSRGAKHRHFGPDSHMTQSLRTSPAIDVIRSAYCAQVAAGGPATLQRHTNFKIGWNFLGGSDGILRSFLNIPRQFVGSFRLIIEGDANGGAMFTAYNETTLKSFLLHIPGVQNVNRGEGPGATMTQTYWWTEANPCN